MSGRTHDRRGAGARFRRAHAHYDIDLAFWLRHARRVGGPVLDLGSAAGRVAVPLARAGIDVIALDRDPEMLGEAVATLATVAPDAAGRLQVVEADLAAFDLAGSATLAIASMNTLQVLVAPEDRIGCLGAVRRALRPGGELVFDVALPDFGDLAASLGVVRQLAAWSDDEGSVAHWAVVDDLDPITQTMLLRTTVDLTDAAGRLERTVDETELHLYTPCELELLLTTTGFEIVDLDGGFAGEPLDPSSERQVYRCRVAEAA